jgi:hypothetical protein
MALRVGNAGATMVSVIPAKAGIHLLLPSTTKIKMDSGLRRNDEVSAPA